MPVDPIEALSDLVRQATNIVVLTGAGISTESGIPDFRSPGGLWSKYRIIDYREFIASEEARHEDWKRRFEMADQIGEVGPNIGHEVLAAWVAEGRCSKIITQNVDGLHQAAGVGDDHVIEIHGTARHAECVDCGLRHEIADCRTMFEATGAAPRCTVCDGIIKSAVVMFGQMMPEDKVALAVEAAHRADLFVAIGSSLVVHPAATLPLHAKRAGAKLAIVNREATELDPFADLLVHDEIGRVLGRFTQ